MLLGIWGAALWTSQWVQSKALAGVRGETLIFFWNFSAWNKSNLAQNTFSLKVSLASVSHTIYFVMFSFYGKKMLNYESVFASDYITKVPLCHEIYYGLRLRWWKIDVFSIKWSLLHCVLLIILHDCSRY